MRLKCSSVKCRKSVNIENGSVGYSGINLPICDKCLCEVYQLAICKLLENTPSCERKFDKSFHEATRYVVSAGALPC